MFLQAYLGKHFFSKDRRKTYILTPARPPSDCPVTPLLLTRWWYLSKLTPASKQCSDCWYRLSWNRQPMSSKAFLSVLISFAIQSLPNYFFSIPILFPMSSDWLGCWIFSAMFWFCSIHLSCALRYYLQAVSSSYFLFLIRQRHYN